MNVDSFLQHHGVTENPFRAEEARHDPLFDRLIKSTTAHPDFEKILGQVGSPSTAVVFGEKGSGKTAIRLLIGQKVLEHNKNHPDKRTLLVAYDDLNPVLDRVMERRSHSVGFRRAAKTTPEQMLEAVRQEDHQDAILSLAVTKLVDALLGDTTQMREPMTLPAVKLSKLIRKMPRQLRVDAAILAALYDQPRGGTVAHRWRTLKKVLRLGWLPTVPIYPLAGGVALVLAVVMVMWHFIAGDAGPPAPVVEGAGAAAAAANAAQQVAAAEPLVSVELAAGAPLALPLAGLAVAAALALFTLWGLRQARVWSLARKIHRDLLAVDRSAGDLRHMLMELTDADLANHPWPVSTEGPSGVGHQDSRYQLTNRLLNVLGAFGYTGVIVLVDRVDEPTLVAGQPQRMRSIVWPMLDNKFLQQERVGLKLLLPVELRHLLHRESAGFFQEARLDKQNMIDRLSWSGATLYDMCTWRLRVCGPSERGSSITLSDLFEEGVTREGLVDALDQMHQPRDAFKFLYGVIQEHCRMIPDDKPEYRISRITLDTARRQQAQRVQELHRGLAPA